MISKKLVIILMAVYFIVTLSIFTYAALLTPIIARLAPAGAAATGIGGGFTIPAKILARTSTGANVASWIALAVPGLTGAKLAIAIMGVGGILAADYLQQTDWFKDNKISKNQSGTGSDFTKMEEMTMPSNFPYTYYYGDITSIIASKLSGPVNGNGILASQAAALAARDAYRAAHCSSSPAGTVTNYYFTMGYYVSCPDEARQIWFYITYFGSGTNKQEVPMGKSSGDIEGDLADDLSNEDPAAKQTVKEALNVAAAAMENPGHPVAQNTNTYNTINNYLTQNITTNQLTNLEASATPNVGDQVLPETEATQAETLTPAQIAAAVQAALQGQGLSASQIAAAIAAAQAAQAGGLTQAEAQAAVAAALAGAELSAAQIQAAVDAAITAAFPPVGVYTGGQAIGAAAWVAPAVGDFAGLFSSFLEDMKNTPLFSLPGLLSDSVPSGGSCEMSVNMSERFGGTKTISICNWETGLSGVKAALLCVASIFAIGIVTKGGG